MQFRDLHAQYEMLKKEIDSGIDEVLSSSAFIGGPQVKQLEAKLADYVGVKYCITCGNGTDALQLALMAWGVGPGDAVFVPDFTFFSSGEVVSAVGATPVFVDVEADTFNISVKSLENAIAYVSENTELNLRAVVAVDLFGQPADYPALRPLCDKYGMLILEDGAQGFGGQINNARACSFGDIGTTSFFPAKPLGCYGDGGAVFTDDDEWAALVRSYAVHGKGSMKYDNIRVGMNSRLDTLQAAVLLPKLHAFADHEMSDVNRVAKMYDEALQPLMTRGVKLPAVLEDFTSSWAQYTIQLPHGFDRDSLQVKAREQDVPTMVYYPKPMHEQLAFKDMGLCPDGCPNTMAICKVCLSLPMGPYMLESDIELVTNILKLKI